MTRAKELEAKAMELSKNYLLTEAEILTVMQMRREKLFRELSYSGIFEFCEKKLNLSRAQAYYFKTVAEKSEIVPELKVARDRKRRLVEPGIREWIRVVQGEGNPRIDAWPERSIEDRQTVVDGQLHRRTGLVRLDSVQLPAAEDHRGDSARVQEWLAFPYGQFVSVGHR